MSIALAAASGCFRYHVVPAAQLRAGDDVSVSISASGSQALVSTLGPRVVRLDGRLVDGDSTLTVSVSGITREGGLEEFWSGDAVRVPISAIDSVRVRSFDGRRSLLASAGAVAFAVATRAVVAGDAFGRGIGSGPPASR